jgi:hypothetical protein
MHKSTEDGRWVARQRLIIGDVVRFADYKHLDGKRPEKKKKVKKESLSLNYGHWLHTKRDWSHVFDGHFRNNNEYDAEKSFNCFIGLLESLSKGKVHWAYSLEQNEVLHVHSLIHLTNHSLTRSQIKKAWTRYGRQKPFCEQFSIDDNERNGYRFKMADKDVLGWDVDRRIKHQLQGD